MKPQTIVYLGRQPKISLAEIEAVAGPDAIDSYTNEFALLSTNDLLYDRLGGITKASKIVATSDQTAWASLHSSIQAYLASYSDSLADGKLTVGLSVYGIKVSSKDIDRCLFNSKKELRKRGRSMRIVSSKTPQLSTAQVLHNGLVKTHKIELNVCLIDGVTYLSQTSWIQDLDAYTKRDRQRPARDAKVGMLPPKLAQILVNLAVGQSKSTSVLDAFCGTGVLLQEAALMGMQVYGTDLEPRMIEYSQKNLEWLAQTHSVNLDTSLLEVGDAQTHVWQKKFDCVAGESYLGTPLFEVATSETLQNIVPDVSELHHAFFKNLSTQIKSGTRVAIGVPAWKQKEGGFKHLPCLDSLESLGYNRLEFTHSSWEDLIYHRPNQAVAREIIVLERK